MASFSVTENLQETQNFKNWSTSSANKFGPLENEFGELIKNLTNTIAFITRNKIPHNRRKDVMYGQFVFSVRPKKKEKKEQYSQ